MIPQEFSIESYIHWHESKYEDDKPLVEKLVAYRNDLKDNAKEKLELICSVLEYAFSYCKQEYKISKGFETNYETPLFEALKDTKNPRYDSLFKSTDSIINKLWRKNKSDEKVVLSNMSQKITDLVRTEIVTPSLDSAQFLSVRINNLNILTNELKQKFDSDIKEIKFEPEMKMASGYFAYHGLVWFTDGLVVELQIYSSLMKEWRKLSHKLYEQFRIKPVSKYEFGTKETRMVSLGHLLHLAECEIQRLESELEK